MNRRKQGDRSPIGQVGFPSVKVCGSFLPYMVTIKNIVRYPIFVKEKGMNCGMLYRRSV